MKTMAIAAVTLAVLAGARTADAGERLNQTDVEEYLLEAAYRPPRIDPDGLSDNPVTCLALAVYWEGRGEPEIGQRAVAHVVLNRARARGYPDDICEVITQHGPKAPCAFSWWCDGRPDVPTNRGSWLAALHTAARAIASPENDPTGGALFFHRKDLTPAWSRHKTGAKVFGEHVFFNLKN